jgi:hypothetical protein
VEQLMPITYTYDGLVAELKDYLEDEFPDFDAQVPNLIGLGEQRMLDDLDLTLFDRIDTTITTTGGQETLSKPSDIIAVRTLSVGGTPLEERSWDWINDYNATAPQGAPKFFSEQSDTEVRLAPVPDASYSATYRGTARPDGLSSSNQTTWLSTNFGDTLLYACLIEAERYVGADQVQVWQQAYMNEKLPAAMNLTRRMSRSDYRPLAAQPQPAREPRNRSTA